MDEFNKLERLAIYIKENKWGEYLSVFVTDALSALRYQMQGIAEEDWPSDCVMPKSATALYAMGDAAELGIVSKSPAGELHERAELFLHMAGTYRLIVRLRGNAKKAYGEDVLVKLDQAIGIAMDSHRLQKRDSGAPYIIHPLEVADMIIDFGMDDECMIAGVLHDVVEDGGVEVKQIEEQFGPGIAGLVDGVTKLTKASFKSTTTKEQVQGENVRKMLLAMAKDVRVIPVKLVDRLHNMRTLEYCNSEKRVRKAKETLEIYAPLAHRLGMGVIRCELEDLSFMHMDPEAYEELTQKTQKLQSETMHFMLEAIGKINAKLGDVKIKAAISGRPKHIYSIYTKMQKQKCNFEEVYDLIAIRIIVDSVEDCYSVLGIIHSMWKPLPFRIKDYISTPKPNLYQSLHTTLIGENGLPFEVQIRTQEMHRTAEYGIASHWKYKEGRSASNDLDVMLNWVRQLIDENVEDSSEFLKMLKLDFFSDYVFVFTPAGEIIDLVVGSTPIDFAYRIHSAIGNRCVGAKVNGKLVPLSHELAMGDIVEIITSNSQNGPSRDWLKVVKTQQAKAKIRAWFKKELKVENIERGKDMLEREARRQGYFLANLVNTEEAAHLFRRLSINTLEDLYAAVGFGSLTTGQVLPRLIEHSKKTAKAEEALQKLEEQMKLNPALLEKSSVGGIIVEGEADMLVRIAKCCSPVPGDDIVGYITRGRGVSVHKADCRNLAGLADIEERAVQVCWAKSQPSGRFSVSVQARCVDRPGLVIDISQLFININITLKSFNAKSDKNFIACIGLEFDVRDTAQLNVILAQIKRINGVIEAYRINS